MEIKSTTVSTTRNDGYKQVLGNCITYRKEIERDTEDSGEQEWRKLVRGKRDEDSEWKSDFREDCRKREMGREMQNTRRGRSWTERKEAAMEEGERTWRRRERNPVGQGRRR